jgi:tetratricopeptide (TPR) repeat protein
MIRLCLLIALLAASALPAQEPAQPEPPVEKAAEIPADYSEYVRKIVPGADPLGEHNLFKLKDYTDKDKRHQYTATMAQLVLVYLKDLEMGSTLTKLFDQYARGKYGEYATFKVLHALVLSQYPSTGSNLDQAEKIFREAADQFKDFAYPWFYLAQIEIVRAEHDRGRGIQPAIVAISKAIQIQPDFLPAIALKAQLLAGFSSTRTAEAIALLEPVLKGKLPADPETYAELLQVYFMAAGPDAFHQMVDAHLKREDLSDRHRMHALVTKAAAYVGAKQADDAIAILEEVEKKADPRTEPAQTLKLRRMLADAWAGKAKALIDEDPSLTNTRKDFEVYLAAAATYYESAAEADRLYMPIAMRGIDAGVYVTFLFEMAKLEMRHSVSVARRRAEQAATWLDRYLKDKETNLSGIRRNTLENLRSIINLTLNPTEDGYLDVLSVLDIENDVDKIRHELATTRERVRMNAQVFTKARALDLFLRFLDSRERPIVRDAAFLAADTARRIGPEAAERAGKAIAEKFETEEELNSDEQGDLQYDLCESIRLLFDSKSMERVLRHMAVLAENSSNTIKLQRIMRSWAQDDFLSRIPNAPANLSRLKMGNNADCATWLRAVADAIKKNREGS